MDSPCYLCDGPARISPGMTQEAGYRLVDRVDCPACTPYRITTGATWDLAADPRARDVLRERVTAAVRAGGPVLFIDRPSVQSAIIEANQRAGKTWDGQRG